MPTMLQTDCHLEIDHVWEMFKATGEAYYRNLLVDHYHYLVERTAQHLRRKLPGAVELDDLISAGVFGLMNAVEAFDRGRAVQFKTYCVHRIRGAILDELRRTDWVPRSVRSRAGELSGAVQSLELHLGRRPSEREIADELGLDESEVEKLQRCSMAPRMTSLDEICHEGEDSEGMSPMCGTVRVGFVADPIAEVVEVAPGIVEGFGVTHHDLCLLLNQFARHVDGG